MNRRVAAMASVTVAALGFLVAWRLSVGALEQERWRRRVLARRFDAVCERTLANFEAISSELRETSPMAMRSRWLVVETARARSRLLQELAQQCYAPGTAGVRSVGLMTTLADVALPEQVDDAAADLAEWAAGYRAALDEARTAEWAAGAWERRRREQP